MLRSKMWAAGILGLSLLLTSCGGKSPENTIIAENLMVPEDVNYTTVTVERGDLAVTATGMAELEFPLSAEVTWEEENSRVKEVKVSAGNEVKKGDVLAVFEVEISAAEKADLELQLKRKKDVFAQGKAQREAEIAAMESKKSGLSSHEKKIAEQKLAALKISLEQFIYQTSQEVQALQERVDELYASTETTTLVAPFDGVIRYAYLTVGQRVEPGTTAFSLYSEKFYYFRVTDAPENFRYGMPVTIITGKQENLQKSYTGVVVSAPNTLPSHLSQDYVQIQLDEEVSAAEFYYNIRYEVVTRKLEDVLIVSKKALHQQGNLMYVNILEDGAIKKRYVTEGWSNSEVSWIVDGLSEGQILVVE